MKSDCSNKSGAWMLTLATIASAAVLFLPLHVSFSGQDMITWVEAEQIGAVLALALAAGAFWVSRRHFGLHGAECDRKLRNALVLVLLQALLVRMAADLGPTLRVTSWSWWPAEAWVWVPWFLTSGLAAMLLGSRLGFLTASTGVFLLYLRANPGPLPLVGCMVSSLYGIILLRRPTRRRALRAGLAAGSLLGAVALVHGLEAHMPLEAIMVSAAVPMLLGLLSAFAVLAMLPLFEWTLGELSDVTLVEYASEHPLLDRLKEEAPGTWHHSLNVADLAEKAAAAIGARALFCRTAALYHDIGKMTSPSMFAENITGTSPHDNLDARVSATRIIEHVSKGLELAREYRLPKPFRHVIAEHHGTSMVRYFFAKACGQLREGEDPEALRPHFCYPGPPPSSRESGIIALADVVEAATRSPEASAQGDARAFVRKLIADRIAEGQLAHCHLTLAELAQVEDTFGRWVQARHHHRPSYPSNARRSVGNSSQWANAPQAAQYV